MKLMYDNSDVSFEQELTEGLEKKYRIKGIFSTPEKQNKNGRIYPMQIWEREVAKYQDILKSGHPNCLMELEHPPRSQVDMMEAVARIDKLYIENGFVMGEATLLDNPKANQLKTLIDNGIKMSVSSRGVGSVKGNIVENYNLVNFDVIANLGQSDHSAEMYGIVEGVLQDKNFLITESGEIKEVQVEQEPEPEQIVENIETDIPEKVELSEAQKAELRDNIINKFKDLFNSSLNEGIKVNSKMAAIQVIQMAKDKISDEKVKDMLDSAINFLAKEFNVKIEKVNEAKMIKNKFKKGQIVQFYDAQGKKTEGAISKFEYDETANGNWSYFYDIEGLTKLFKDVPEGDIIK